MKPSHPFQRSAVAVAFPFAVLLSGCATKLTHPITGYTCCNLRPDYGWVSGANMLGGPIVPAGEPVVLDTMKRDRYVYSGLIRAQWNRTPLTPQDRFAIGGRYTVRGFDGETSLMGERGWLLRNDIG